jgi:hypothetical protein
VSAAIVALPAAKAAAHIMTRELQRTIEYQRISCMIHPFLNTCWSFARCDGYLLSR